MSFSNQLETLSDSSVNWISYVAYYDDMTWVYYAIIICKFLKFIKFYLLNFLH
jgi:hypothetical protein